MSFIYLNSEKSKILFDNYTNNIKSMFKTVEIKWRCCQCKNVTLNAKIETQKYLSFFYK